MKLKFISKALMTTLISISTIASPVLATTYTYDNLGRLTSVTYDSGQSINYTYDPSGNMTSSKATSQATLSKEITAFSLPQETQTATIDTVNKTISVTVGTGTELTNLIPTFSLPDNTTAKVGDIEQVSGTTPNDFTQSVVYKVIAIDNTEQDWTVTVNVATPNIIQEIATLSEASNTGFNISISPALENLQAGDISLRDSSNNTITIDSLTSVDSGSNYRLNASLIAGQTYTITLNKDGYNFGDSKSVIVPEENTNQEPVRVSEVNVSGFNLTFSSGVNNLYYDEMSLKDSSNNTISIYGINPYADGMHYKIRAGLQLGQTYTLTITRGGYDFGQPLTVAVPSEPIQESVSIDKPYAGGFVIAARPMVTDWSYKDIAITDNLGNNVPITGMGTSDGAAYNIDAQLTLGETYTVTCSKYGYDFGQPQQVTITSEMPQVDVTVSNISGNGFTFSLSQPILNLDMEPGAVILKDSNNSEIPIMMIMNMDNGTTYNVDQPLDAGETYTLIINKVGYDIEPIAIALARNIQPTVSVSNLTTSGFTLSLDPAVPDLQAYNTYLISYSPYNFKSVASLTTTDGGKTYDVVADLVPGVYHDMQIYASGYEFQNLPVITLPLEGNQESIISINNTTSSSITIGLAPFVSNLQAGDFVLKGDQNQPISITGCEVGADGYTLLTTLETGKTYSLTANKSGYSFNTIQVSLPEQPASHTITIGQLTGGNIATNPTSATTGSTITLEVTPDTGMKLKDGTLKYNDGTLDHTITGTQFTMPDSDITITAEFEQS